MNILQGRWHGVLGALGREGCLSGRTLSEPAAVLAAVQGGNERRELPEAVQQAVLSCVLRSKGGEVEDVKVLDLLEATALWGGLNREVESLIVKKRSKRVAEAIVRNERSSQRLVDHAAPLCSSYYHNDLVEHPNLSAAVRLKYIAQVRNAYCKKALGYLKRSDYREVLTAYSTQEGLKNMVRELLPLAYTKEHTATEHLQWIRMLDDALARQIRVEDLLNAEAPLDLWKSLHAGEGSKAVETHLKQWGELSVEARRSVKSVQDHANELEESALGSVLLGYDKAMVEAVVKRPGQSPGNLVALIQEGEGYPDVHRITQITQWLAQSEAEAFLYQLAQLSPVYADICLEALTYIEEVTYETAEKLVALSERGSRLNDIVLGRLLREEGDKALRLVKPGRKVTGYQQDEEKLAKWLREEMETKELEIFLGLIETWEQSAGSLINASKELAKERTCREIRESRTE